MLLCKGQLVHAPFNVQNYNGIAYDTVVNYGRK